MTDHYTPNVVIPMIRMVFPTIVNASDISIMKTGKIRDRVWENEVNKLRGCCFLSRNRIKKLLNGWRPSNSGKISIIVVEYENMVPTWKTTEMFQIPGGKDDFIVELANLSDLHGIIKMSGHEVWVRRTDKPNELNIDATTMDRISMKLGMGRL